MFTPDAAIHMLNGMGSNGPIRFVRKAKARPALFDEVSLAELAASIDLNDNKRPSVIALGSVYAGYLAAKRGLSVQEALSYRYLGGALAEACEAQDVKSSLASLVESHKKAAKERADKRLVSGKAALTASKATLTSVTKVTDVITSGGAVSPETIAQLEAAKAQIEAALASVSVSV